jgi:hypothetical protein
MLRKLVNAIEGASRSVPTIDEKRREREAKKSFDAETGEGTDADEEAINEALPADEVIQ